MMRRYLPLGGAVALAAACAPAPFVPTTGVPVPGLPIADGAAYPAGNPFRLLATDEAPIVAVSVDSQAAGLAPARLADGDLSTQWGSGGYRAASAWAAVELAGELDLTGIALKTGPLKTGASYEVQVSGDGTTWVPVLTNQTNTTWTLEPRPFAAPVRGRFVRVFWRNAATAPADRFAVYELMVTGRPPALPVPTPTPAPTATPTAAPTASPEPPPTPTPEPTPSATPTEAPTPTPTPTPTPLPPEPTATPDPEATPLPDPTPSPAATPTPEPNATATPAPTPTPLPTPTPEPVPGPLTSLRATQLTASASYATLAPVRAVDGDLATQWGSDPYRAPGAWLALAYAERFVFEQLRVKTGALPAGVGYIVEISDDGQVWTAASGVLTNTTWNAETKSIAGRGRHLRLRFSNDPSNLMGRFYVFELEVLGRPLLAPTPAPSAGGWAPQALRRLSTPGSAVTTSGMAALAVDGLPGTSWSPTVAASQAIAVPLAAHPAEPTLLVAWDSGGYHYTNVTTAPRTYELQTSSDSTDGRDGTWAQALRVVDNPTRSHVDAITAPDARWVRVQVQANGTSGLQLRELAVHGAASPDRLNTWLIMGDSISAQAFDPSRPNVFGETVEAQLPGFRPLLVAGGTGGDSAETGRARLVQGLAFCPPGSYVGLAYGTNDATYGVPVATFKLHMQGMIDAVSASGRHALLARTPWSLNGQLPSYVQAVDELRAANGLPAGPDLHSWFQSHPEQLRSDRVHPTPDGERTIQRLWGEAIAQAYRY